jgi:hypothetical protein
MAARRTHVAPSERYPGDQRSNSRYPISLKVQYKLLDKGRVQHLGVGRTLNISKGGVLFEADDLSLVPARGTIELEMSWPFLLEGACSLRLIMRGRIVRVDANVIAVKAEFHAFRTGIQTQQDPSRAAS